QLDGNNLPQASIVLTRDCYMNDILSGGENLDHVLNLQKQLIYLLQQGSFHLRKWCSNNEHILASIDPADCEINLPSQSNDKNSVKTLGISRLFDPLGLLGSVVVCAKLRIEELWELKLSWDNYLPDELACSWLSFKRELPLMANLEIPRRIISLDRYSSLEIHGFCDSLQIAYGARINLKAVDDNGEISICNICAKSRVGSVRPIAIPRLELCSEVFLVRLVHDVILFLNLDVRDLFLWASRAAIVQELTFSYQWNYVPTDSNPADLLTRGLIPSELQGSSL
ncbi:hypothetical protein ILUMI_15604, partial [Ignelater luminosus]